MATTAETIAELLKDAETLRALFDPNSIAILGASQDSTRIGGRPLRYLSDAGYTGSIYPVNPKYAQIGELPCYAELAAVPESVDLVIIALPQAAVSEALDACVAARVKAIVLFSGGFAEVGAEGRRAQEVIGHRVREAGIRLLGPNCLGVANLGRRAIATFASNIEIGLPPEGNIGFVGQSGAFGAYFMATARERKLPLGLWATTGNEADVQFADCLAYMALQPEIAAVAGYLEGCRDGARLRAALELARRRRMPVVLLKGGTTTAGRRAALSHTGALAGDDAAWNAVFEETGAVRVRELDDLIETTAAAALARFPVGRRVGILTVSGGAGILMADRAVSEGLEVPPLPDDVQAAVRARVPFAAPENPVDVTGQVLNEPRVLEDVLRILVQQPDIDALAAFLAHLSQLPSLGDRVIRALVEASAVTDKPILMAGIVSPDAASQLARHQVASVLDPGRAMRTLAVLRRMAISFERPWARGGVAREGGRAEKARELIRETRAAGWRVMPEGRAKALLALYGVPAPRERLARSREEAVAAIDELAARRLVLKIESPDITHRTDAGAIRLDVDPADVAAAYDEIMSNALRHDATARIDGVLVQPMLEAGVELVIGARQDSTFGPVVMAGFGGLLVEVLRDTAFHTAPIETEEAEAVFRKLAAWPLLAGLRGRAPADVAAAAATLSVVSQMAIELSDEIAEVEVNPLIVYPHGRGALAADALLVLKEV